MPLPSSQMHLLLPLSFWYHIKLHPVSIRIIICVISKNNRIILQTSTLKIRYVDKEIAFYIYSIVKHFCVDIVLCAEQKCITIVLKGE